MEVLKQVWKDSPDGLFSALYLKGMWENLSLHEVTVKGSAPFFKGRYEEDTTVYSIMGEIFTEAGHSLDALALDDGITGTYRPNFYLNDYPPETADYEHFRLISMTKSYLRDKAGLTWEIIYPQESDAVDETYYSDQVYWFYRYDEDLNELIPNHIIVYCNKGTNNYADLITGEAKDDTAIARYKDVTNHIQARYITNQGDATNRAIALLAKAKTSVRGALLVIPMDHRVQLYDKPQIISTRGV